MVEGAGVLKRAIVTGAIVGLLAAVTAVILLRGGAAVQGTGVIPGAAGVHLQVEVLNGVGVDGLARAITLRLRRAGIDVVSFGTGDDSNDVTVLLVRRGDSAVAVPVREALGIGRIEVAPDASLLLDVSVLLGTDATGLVRDP